MASLCLQARAPAVHQLSCRSQGAPKRRTSAARVSPTRRAVCSLSGDALSTPATSQRVHGNLFQRAHLKERPFVSEKLVSSVDDETIALLPESLTSFLTEVLGKALKPALISLLVTALLWQTPGDALAAQGGGRVGGSSGFSASRSRTYSPPAQSYSRGGYSGQSYVAPSPSFTAPFFLAPSWGWGFGPTVYVGGGGGGGIFNFIILGIVAYFVLSAVLSFWGQTEEEEIWEASQRSSVVRLQVGLMGTARQLQKDLERMANRADTSTPEGLHYVLQESVLSLLRNPDYCIYGYSTSEVTRDSYEGEQAFNRLSLEERSKFREETLVNVGDVRKRVTRDTVRDTVGSEYIVVTIIAATEGEFRLPEIRSQADLRSALTVLGSITSEDLQAVEILWTPENEEDTLTTKDMLQDYPLLRPL